MTKHTKKQTFDGGYQIRRYRNMHKQIYVSNICRYCLKIYSSSSNRTRHERSHINHAQRNKKLYYLIMVALEEYSELKYK